MAQALQQFLTIWRQDPAAQYNLEICPQSILLWDPENPLDAKDLTSTIGTPQETVEVNDYLETLFSEKVSKDLTALSKERKETEKYKKVKEELIQDLLPQDRSHPNPFLEGT